MAQLDSVTPEEQGTFAKVAAWLGRVLLAILIPLIVFTETALIWRHRKSL